MIIKTKKFILRSPKKGDEDSLWENYNDKTIAKNMVLMETEKEFKGRWKDSFKKKKGVNLINIIEVNGNSAGAISLRGTDEYNKTKATISYWIGKKYRNKGITTKALRLFTDYAFKKLKLVRIQANVRTFNKASARILEKAGYKLGGIRRKNVLKEGKFYDDFLYARVR